MEFFFKDPTVVLLQYTTSCWDAGGPAQEIGKKKLGDNFPSCTSEK